jgi:hypothetical protein
MPVRDLGAAGRWDGGGSYQCGVVQNLNLSFVDLPTHHHRDAVRARRSGGEMV